MKDPCSSAVRRLAPGSLILLTGVTGYIGSAQAWSLLELGYRIRGVTREAKRAQLLSEKVTAQYGKDALEIVECVEYTIAKYKTLFEGVSGFIHMGMDTTYDGKPREMIKDMVDWTLAILQAAAETPSVKAGLLTSSRVAVFHPEPGQTIHVDASKEIWNDDAVRHAHSSCTSPMKAVWVYMACKVEMERAAWTYIDEHRVDYAFNTTVPDFVLGRFGNPDPSSGSSGRYLQEYYHGDKNGVFVMFNTVPAGYISMDDLTTIQSAALLEPDIDRERIWASAGAYSLAETNVILRRLSQGKEAFEDQDVPPPPIIHAEHEQGRALDLLRRYGRAGGFESFEDAVTQTLEDSRRRVAHNRPDLFKLPGK